MKTKLISAVLAAALMGSAVSAAGMDFNPQPEANQPTQAEQAMTKDVGGVTVVPSGGPLPEIEDAPAADHLVQFAHILS